ncbi:unnamed protein product, partial [Prunus brigantina]
MKREDDDDNARCQIKEDDDGRTWGNPNLDTWLSLLRRVSKEGFVSVFARMWRGTTRVSIKEFGDSQFLMHFGNLKDKLRVLDMEPWTFRDCLMVLAEYCFICGCLGHPSRFCVEKLDDQHGDNVVTKESLLGFDELEAEENMSGRRLRSNRR